MGLDGKPLLIRADANTQMGTGHLMRCFALGQEWQARGGEAEFITACDSKDLLQRLRDEGLGIVELTETYPEPNEWEVTSRVLALHPDAWVVLDGYHFDSAYQRRIKATGHPLLVIDDIGHLDHYHADVVLNQNLSADFSLYPSMEPNTRLLLGTRYALLRREFQSWQGWQRTIPEVAHRTLITLGGSDPRNVTSKVIQGLSRAEIANLEVRVVIGAGNPHYEELLAVAQTIPAVSVVRNVTNMAGLMAWADVAVSAAGSTCWELAFMRTPMILIVLAENQVSIATALEASGCAINLGKSTNISPIEIRNQLAASIFDQSLRQHQALRGRECVDGFGVARVLDYLRR